MQELSLGFIQDSSDLKKKLGAVSFWRIAEYIAKERLGNQRRERIIHNIAKNKKKKRETSGNRRRKKDKSFAISPKQQKNNVSNMAKTGEMPSDHSS